MLAFQQLREVTETGLQARLQALPHVDPQSGSGLERTTLATDNSCTGARQHIDLATDLHLDAHNIHTPEVVPILSNSLDLPATEKSHLLAWPWVLTLLTPLLRSREPYPVISLLVVGTYRRVKGLRWGFN